MDNASARNLWGDYLDKHLEDAFHEAPNTYFFYDNEEEANKSVELVQSGVKTAASYSLIQLQQQGKSLPKIGDFSVITNFKGDAKCIIETTKVTLKPFFSIASDYAKKQGEGDSSLPQWKEVQWKRFTSALAPFNKTPKESMIVVCQEFKMVFKR